MINLCFVASGSKGNATLLSDGDTLIQIDMGVSLKTLRTGLAHFGKSVREIDALFITHGHDDHISGVPLFHGKIPIFATEGTLDEAEVFEVIEPYVGVNVGNISIFPFPTSHDAPNPVGYLISAGETKLGYVTDTGTLDDTALSLLHDCDYYLFESNHDLEMLLKSNRPKILKDRIRGDYGHLSNADSASFLSSLVGPKTKAIYLAHLSEECNTPDKALSTQRRILEEKGVDLGKVKVVLTNQWKEVLGGDWAI